MKTSIKSIHTMKATLLIRTLLACLVVVAFSFAALPTWARDPEADAKEAFDKWKAAAEGVAEAKKKLKEANESLTNMMVVVASGGITEGEEATLAKARAKVAAAEAALKDAEAKLDAARIALEEAIAALPDSSKLKKELIRKRDGYIAAQRFAGAATVSADAVTANGMRIANFDTANGRVIVNLPDDMHAGDTISGTVMAEPKGETQEERAKNRGELSGYVVELKVPQPSAPGNTAQPSDIKVAIPGSGAYKPFTFNVPTFGSTSSTSSPRLGISLSNPSAGSPIVSGSTMVPIQPTPSVSNRPPTPTANDYQLPTLGQQGRPVEISGPFDGSFENTTLKVGGQDVETLTESPRGLVFGSPTNVTGPVEIMLKEGDVETKGQYRNVGVNLSAPKTTLLKGERTTLTVQITGLQGISEPVPLTLDSRGVITMEGGMHQPLVIQPSQVGADGRYTTTRNITGVQAGGWGATATVVTNQAQATPGQGVMPSPTPQTQKQPADTPSGPGGLVFAKVQASELKGQTVHIEGSPGDFFKEVGGKGLWKIKIKTPAGEIEDVFIAGDQKPDLEFCNYIKIGDAQGSSTLAVIDSYEKVPKPPDPPGPKPGDTGPATPPVEPRKPGPEGPPAPPGEKTEPARGETTVKECDPEGAKKTTTRIEVTCELSEAVVTPLGINPTGQTLLKIAKAILKVAGLGKGAKLGEKIAGAFSTSEARHVWVKVRKTTTTYKDLYVCQNGKWVLKGQDGAPTVVTSESDWIKLRNPSGGVDYWMDGDGAYVDAAADTAKEGYCK